MFSVDDPSRQLSAKYTLCTTLLIFFCVNIIKEEISYSKKPDLIKIKFRNQTGF